jgi:GTP1/Obg family GTP-binding protein
MFKVVRDEAKDNLNKITPRKVLALWLILAIVLYLIVPRVINLKEYKDDYILFAMIILSFVIMASVVIISKLIKKSK